MNYTPTETHAMARARTIAPMSDADRAALPIDSATWTPTQRRLAREHRLAHAAEALRNRELQTALYRHAIDTHDRQTKHDLRVTALDTSTRRLRADLLDAYRALLDLDDTPLFAYVPRNRPIPRTALPGRRGSRPPTKPRVPTAPCFCLHLIPGNQHLTP